MKQNLISKRQLFRGQEGFTFVFYLNAQIKVHLQKNTNTITKSTKVHKV